MTIPNFLSNAYAPFRYYTERVGVVGEIITRLRSELTALGWTEPVANTFQCPSDGAGHWMRCYFYQYSGAVLQMSLSDQNGTTICIRTLSVTSGGAVFYYTGKFHCFIEALNNDATGVYSYLAAFLLDTTPDPPASSPSHVIGNGATNSVGGYDGQGLFERWFALDNAAAQVANRLRGPVTFGGSTYAMTMASGRGIFDECLIYQLIGGSGAANYVWTGRFCQALIGPTVPNIVGAEYQIPIDDGTVATFKATSHFYLSGVYPYPCRLWMRKS